MGNKIRTGTPLEDNSSVIFCYGMYWKKHSFKNISTKLRRSGGGLPTDFGFVLTTDKFDSVAAKAYIDAGGGTQEGFCNIWYDISNSGDVNNLTMATEGLQPEILFDQYGQDGDLPCLDMNGKYLKVAALTQPLSGDYTIFIVCTNVASGNILDGVAVDTYLRCQFQSGRNVRVYDKNGHEMLGSIIKPLGELMLISITIRTPPATSYLHINGVEDGTSTVMDGTLPGLTLGAIFSGATDYTGKIVDSVGFTTALSDAGRQDVERDLNEIYDIW